MGERIVGIVDTHGESRGAPAVLIPPAWGKTKETLLPLARTITAMFAKVNKSVTVLRFDGTMRRGESENEPRFRMPGREHHGFTFSQAVRDIQASVRFLSESDEFRANGVVLVTYSIAAIEGRRAVADNVNGSIAGWVSIVGPSDLQSTVQSVAGGIDYLGGHERGLRFGIREILGVEVDIDRTADDALEHGLGFLSDSCRDFENIQVPVTWIHGAFDGWMDLERVRKVLSAGDLNNRRLLVVPSGHQLRNSRGALEIFSQVAKEVGRMAGCARTPSAVPDLAEMEARGSVERSRIPTVSLDVRAFWRNYLLGREGRDGMALMIRTPIYQELMDLQVRELDLGQGQVIADLGSGLGALSSFIATQDRTPRRVRIIEVELVQEALRAEMSSPSIEGPIVHRVVADLGVKAGRVAVPLSDMGCDAVLASLLISYLPNPQEVLADALRILRPGGRIVVSTLRRDADFSKIWGDNASTLRRANETSMGEEADSYLDASLNSFFNDAVRVLDLEEAGVFEFYEPEELAGLMRRAGFVDVRAKLGFGHPPQAIIVSARRPVR
jgi:SAM-dependent methyltransferase/pimeloyl-ACP methyl ester carboxylesterase